MSMAVKCNHTMCIIDRACVYESESMYLTNKKTKKQTQLN